MSENEVVPDEFRCNRSDGKQWRCKRRALEGKKLCETHTAQLTQKRSKQKASESMKLARSRKGAEAASSEIELNASGIRAKELGKSKKRKRVMGEAEAVDEGVRKMKLKKGDLQLDLIKMTLKREVEKKKKRSPNKKKKKKKKEKEISINKGFGDFVREELTKVLPNGIMVISPPSPTTSNVSSPYDVKVDEEPISMPKRRFRSKNIDVKVDEEPISMPKRRFRSKNIDVKVDEEPISMPKRRFRSKNVEPLPIGKMQVVPFKGKLVNAKKRCHWCGTRGFEDLRI